VMPIAMPASGAVTKKQVVEWRQQIRRALFIPDTLPSLQPRVYGSFSPVPGVIAEGVTYGTEYGLRIPAILYRPSSSAGKIPGLVVVNGHGADKSSWYSWYMGILYARAGAAVLTYDPIGEGERNDSHEDATGEHDTVIDVPGVPQRMGGLMVTDVMQGVSYLRSLPQVDSRRIAVLGFSMGPSSAALRVRSTIVSTPFCLPAEAIWTVQEAIGIRAPRSCVRLDPITR
jgi:dipeptidyl aminopeptidase/acylaminoacyl peptidase